MKKNSFSLILMTFLLFACSSSEEEEYTTGNQNNEDQSVTNSETEENGTEEMSNNTRNENDESENIGNNSENDDFEQFEYEGAYPDTGIDIESSEETLEEDMHAFFPLLESETGQEYTFYLRSVATAVDVRRTIPTHYNRFMEATPTIIRDIEQIELKSDEMDFARQAYLNAIEIHYDAVEALEPHIDDIHDESHDPQLEEAFQHSILEGNHQLALFAVQMVKIAEETDLMNVHELHDLEDMIDEFLIKEEL